MCSFSLATSVVIVSYMFLYNRFNDIRYMIYGYFDKKGVKLAAATAVVVKQVSHLLC